MLPKSNVHRSEPVSLAHGQPSLDLDQSEPQYHMIAGYFIRDYSGGPVRRCTQSEIDKYWVKPNWMGLYGDRKK